jgi:sigma-B regulation protein RsbU (phosphoserine phosphatase)
MFAKILVVDDEPDLEHLVRQKFRKQIRSNEFQFIFAENGVEALHKLEADSEVDLVLTDINMPEMDGLTLLTKLRELDLILKPVIISAYGDMENIRTAMNRGAFDFVTKPIDLQDLETTIDKSLKELRMFKEAVQARDKLVAIEQELNIATEIQTSILPRSFPAFPDRNEFDIYAKMATAKEVGGDFYDFFPIDKNRIGFVIGDVSGKGVPAAMLMTMSRTLLKATALKGIPSDECLREINNVLVAESLSTMFVTIFYAVLDTRNGMLEYCNGGHNLPYLVSKNGDVKQVENIGGLFVGAMKDVEYESTVIMLQPGDSLFLYTDGVTEAEDKTEEEFQEKRLEECLRSTNGAGIEEMVDDVIREVRTFSDGMPQTDDITCMVLRFSGK